MASPVAGSGTVRRLWPGEQPLLAEHLKRLDSVSRACRFGGALSDEAVDAYVASVAGSGVVFAYVEEGVVRGAAELRGTRANAEAAFSVEKDWQGQGIGSALFGRLLRVAQSRAIPRLQVSCLAENGAMRRIAAKHGARFSPGSVEITGDVAPERITPLSVLREIASAGCDAALSIFDRQTRLLRCA